MHLVQATSDHLPADLSCLTLNMGHLLVAAVLLVAASNAAAKVCPDIPRAAKHFDLRVSEYDLKLPDGRMVPQMAYNGSVVGPPLVFTLGDEVSIDVYNGLKNTCALSCPALHEASLIRPPRCCQVRVHGQHAQQGLPCRQCHPAGAPCSPLPTAAPW